MQMLENVLASIKTNLEKEKLERKQCRPFHALRNVRTNKLNVRVTLSNLVFWLFPIPPRVRNPLCTTDVTETQ